MAVLQHLLVSSFPKQAVNSSKTIWSLPGFVLNTEKRDFKEVFKKCKTANTIILTEGDMIIKNETLIADTFNNYFADITKTLKLKKHPNFDGQPQILMVSPIYSNFKRGHS